MNPTPPENPPVWMEISIRSDPATHEAVEYFLMEDLGCDGVWIEEAPDEVLKAYLPGDTDIEELRRRIDLFLAGLLEIFPGIEAPMLRLGHIRGMDWRTAWRSYFRPERITSRLLILPAWEEIPPGTDCPHVLRVDPGPAFGTGQHPTTRMCLQALEAVAPRSRDWDLLDVGTGSGILAVYGVMLGACHVDAVDIDEEALSWAEWNIRLNGAEDAIRLSSDPLSSFTRRYLAVCANLILHTILELMPLFPRLVRPDGRLILSGLLREQVREVIEELGRMGLLLSRVLEQEEWACVLAAPKA